MERSRERRCARIAARLPCLASFEHWRGWRSGGGRSRRFRRSGGACGAYRRVHCHRALKRARRGTPRPPLLPGPAYCDRAAPSRSPGRVGARQSNSRSGPSGGGGVERSAGVRTRRVRKGAVVGRAHGERSRRRLPRPRQIARYPTHPGSDPSYRCGWVIHADLCLGE